MAAGSFVSDHPAVALALVALVLGALVILRRIGLRLDEWYAKRIPLNKRGQAFLSYYGSVALIWLILPALLLQNDAVEMSTAAWLMAVVWTGVLLAAWFRKRRRERSVVT